MGLLGDATTVEARTGRKLSNALMLTFKVGEGDPIAVATQKGGMGVLFGFKNGGPGRYTVSSSGDTLDVDCAKAGTTVTRAGHAVGTIDEDGDGSATLRGASGDVLARWAGYPYGDRAEPTWPYALAEPDGKPLGTLRLLRTSVTFDLVQEVVDTAIWFGHAGAPLKVPTLGARLDLQHPVAPDLGDLLLAACVDAAVAAHDHLRR